MKTILTIILLSFIMSTFAQNSATFKSSVGVCIVDINDTIVKETKKPVIEKNMKYKHVVENFNKPNKIIVMKNNKVKFIFDDCFVYFNNGTVELIQKRK